MEAETGKRTPWRTVSSNVLTEEFGRALDAIGWRYVPGKGRVGSRFERTQPIDPSCLRAPEGVDRTMTESSEEAVSMVFDENAVNLQKNTTSIGLSLH
jgi:hypothetical protein